jgi:hypothetical protein
MKIILWRSLKLKVAIKAELAEASLPSKTVRTLQKKRKTTRIMESSKSPEAQSLRKAATKTEKIQTMRNSLERAGEASGALLRAHHVVAVTNAGKSKMIRTPLPVNYGRKL